MRGSGGWRTAGVTEHMRDDLALAVPENSGLHSTRPSRTRVAKMTPVFPVRPFFGSFSAKASLRSGSSSAFIVLGIADPRPGTRLLAIGNLGSRRGLVRAHARAVTRVTGGLRSLVFQDRGLRAGGRVTILAVSGPPVTCPRRARGCSGAVRGCETQISCAPPAGTPPLATRGHGRAYG
jgi:hypothetical protein